MKNESKQPASGVTLAKTKDGQEVQQAKVNVGMFDGVKRLDDQSAVDNLVHSHSAVDSHNAELQAAMAAMKGEDVPDMDAAAPDIDAFENHDVNDPDHENNVQDALAHVEGEPAPESNIEDDMNRAPDGEVTAQPATEQSPAQILVELERKERELRDQQLLLAKERQDMETQTGQATEQLNQLITGMRQSPQAALAMLQQITGYSYQDIAKGVLAGADTGANGAPVGPPNGNGQANPTDQQIAQLTQTVAALQNMITAQPKIQQFEGTVRDMLAQPEYALLNGVQNPLGKASGYAAAYMKKYGVGIEALSPKDILDNMLDVRRQELDSIRASEAALQYLSAGQAGDTPPRIDPAPPVQPPRPTLTSGDDEVSTGATASQPETHRDIVAAALKAIPEGARRGFN